MNKITTRNLTTPNQPTKRCPVKDVHLDHNNNKNGSCSNRAPADSDIITSVTTKTHAGISVYACRITETKASLYSRAISTDSIRHTCVVTTIHTANFLGRSPVILRVAGGGRGGGEHTHTHTHTHTRTHTYIHARTHAHTHTHIHPHPHTHTHTNTHTQREKRRGAGEGMEWGGGGGAGGGGGHSLKLSCEFLKYDLSLFPGNLCSSAPIPSCLYIYSHALFVTWFAGSCFSSVVR